MIDVALADPGGTYGCNAMADSPPPAYSTLCVLISSATDAARVYFKGRGGGDGKQS